MRLDHDLLACTTNVQAARLIYYIDIVGSEQKWATHGLCHGLITRPLQSGVNFWKFVPNVFTYVVYKPNGWAYETKLHNINIDQFNTSVPTTLFL